MDNNNKLNSLNQLDFQRTDGGQGSCFITPEQSREIADFEGLSNTNPQFWNEEQRKIIEEKVLLAIPEEERERVRNDLRDLHEELDGDSNHLDWVVDSELKRKKRISQEFSFDIVDGKLVRYLGWNETIGLVPHGVKTIGENAFGNKNAESIKIIILPETIVNIEKNAFIGCDALRYINFPPSLRNIGSRPFDSLIRLKFIYIPDEVETCKHLGHGLRLESIRLPLHLVNNAEVLDYLRVKTVIVGLPIEDEVTPSQDKIDIEKLCLFRHRPSFVFETYYSSHFGQNNAIKSVNGCLIKTDFTGRNYIPDSEDEEYNYLITLPSGECVIPSIANVLDYKSGWYHTAPVLYVPSTIEFIAPDAFNHEETFVTPAYNAAHLKKILANVNFKYEIITT